MKKFRHHGLIGTNIEIGVKARWRCDPINSVAAETMKCLEKVLSAYDSESELSLWKNGEVEIPSTDLRECLMEAKKWQEISNGLFNISSDAFTALWKGAEESGVEPDESILQKTCEQYGTLPFLVKDNQLVVTGDVSYVTLNSFAKGWIVDRALVEVTARRPRASVYINAGGDIRHHGNDEMLVGVENPFVAFDNQPPVGVVPLKNRAIATSSGARKGFNINGIRYSHLIHPLTGHPASFYASVTILAPTAAMADALATICSFLEPALVDNFTKKLDCDYVLIDGAGKVSSSVNAQFSPFSYLS